MQLSGKYNGRYQLTSVLNFGKYKGHVLSEVVDNDPLYVKWCMDEIDWFNLDYEARAYLNEALSEYSTFGDGIEEDDLHVWNQ